MRRLFFIALLTLFTATLDAAVRFRTAVMMQKDVSAASLAVADMDHDGALDVVAAVPVGIEILYGDMKGGVRETEMIAMPARAQAIALSDLNRDGVADIIAATSDGVWNVLSSARHFAAAQRAPNSDAPFSKIVEINGVGGKITMDGRSKALFVQIGNELERTIELPDVVTSFAIADFDGDGRADIAATTAFSKQTSILIGDGSGGFVAADAIDVAAVPLSVASGDMDRNGHIDLVVAYAKGIAFIPNVTERYFDPPARSRNLRAQSLHPAPAALNAAPCTIAYTFQGAGWSDPLSWSDLTTGAHRVPNFADAACINDPPNQSQPVSVTGSVGVGSLQSFYHGGIQLSPPAFGVPGGTLGLEDSTHSSTIVALTIIQGSLSSAHPVSIGTPLQPGFLRIQDGSMRIFSAAGSDALTVNGVIDWESGSLTTINGPARFTSDSTVFGRLNLCFDTTLVLNPGTTMTLNGGVVTPSSCGSGTLTIFDATVNGIADNFPGIYTNMNVSTFNSPGVRPTISSSGNTGMMSIGNDTFSIQSMAGDLVVGANTTMLIGGQFHADLVRSSGAGTTVVAGTLTGAFTPVTNPLTVKGTLGADPAARSNVTFASGGVTLDGNVVGHDLVINGGNSLLHHACIASGGIVDLNSGSTMDTDPSQFISIDAACGGVGARFHVHPGGTLTINGSMDTDPFIEFENDGVVNLQSGLFTLRGSPEAYTSVGRYNLAAGTRLAVSPTVALKFGGTTTGAGLFQAGTLLSHSASFSNLQASNVDGSFTITGNMEWLGDGSGVLSNGTATIAAGAAMSAPNGGIFSNSFFNVNGTATFGGGCVKDGSTFSVNPGGLASLTVPPSGNAGLSTCGSTGSLLINTNGTLLINGKIPIFLPTQVFGNLEVASGSMTLGAPGSWLAGSQLIVAGGATVLFEAPQQFSSGFQSRGDGSVIFLLNSFSGSPIFFNPVVFDNVEFTGSGGNLLLACCNTNSVPTTLTIDAGNTLTIIGGLTVGTAGKVFNAGTIQNNGTLTLLTNGIAVGGTGSINNARLIAGGSSTGTTIDCWVTNTPSGRIVANSGVLIPQLTNVSGGTLTGGFYEADSGSTLFLSQVNNNAASVTANGGRVEFESGFSNAAGGTLSLLNGGTINIGTFTNNGTVSIGRGSTLPAFTFTQAGGKTSLTDASAQLSASKVVLQGGALEGIGVVLSSVQNNGGDLLLAVGAPNRPIPGTMTIQGNYTEAPTSHLHVFLGQTAYSSLHVTGAVSLAGTIQLDANMGFDNIGDPICCFQPNPGDTFKVLTYGSRSGSFATIDAQTYVPDLIYTPHYNANDLTFVAETQDPKVLIANLETTISNLGIDSGTATSLKSQLEAALSALQRGNASAACGSLGATQNYISAQSGKKLTQDQAAMLTDAVQKIRAKVGCK